MTSKLRILGLVVALVGTHSVAEARPVFPGTVRTVLELRNDPPCATCHVGVPSRFTAKRPIARSLLSSADPPNTLPDGAALEAALGKLASNRVDSDGDGMPDTEELQAERDPNVAESANVDGGAHAQGAETVRDGGSDAALPGAETSREGTESTGCTTGAPISTTAGASSSLALAVILLLCRLRSRATSKASP